MTVSLTPVLTVEEFLKRPEIEASPAWEYVGGVAIQKPMPKTRHSILQKRLLTEIANIAKSIQPYRNCAVLLRGGLLFPMLP
jgi:Uma2 family endonuclease